jgi:predicted aspartyl protease
MRTFELARVFGVVLGLLLCLAGSAAAVEPVATLPYRIDYGGWFTVTGTIKGKGPFDFIIDTGSTKTLIFVNTVDKIGGVYATNGPPVSVVGLSATKKFPTFRIGDVAIGGQVMPDLVTVILQDWTVEGRAPQGVIGLDFLERYHVEFDGQAKLMRLYAKEKRYTPPSAKWRSSAMQRRSFTLDEGAAYTVEMRLNSARVEFLIDLGATGSIVNERAASRGRNLGVAINASETRSTRIVDAVDARSRARPVFFNRISIGKTVWHRAVLIVYDAPVIEELGMSERPFGLIGANLFEDRSFAFDFAEQRLFIGPTVRP